MKRLLLATSVVCLLVAGMVTVKAGDQDFTLRNRTGYTIDEVYVSSANVNSWGHDILGDGQMKDGSSKAIKFSNSASSCHWDLKIVFDDKESAIWEDFDLCSIEEITVHYDGKKPTATWK